MDKQKKELIALAALLMILGVTAAIMYYRSKSGAKATLAALPATAPADASSTAAAPASGAPAEAAFRVPSQDDLAVMGDWLAARNQPSVVALLPSRDPLGLEVAAPALESAERAPEAELLQLTGTIKVGGVQQAVIGDSAYAAGEAVKNSAFKVVAVTENSVTLRSSDGRELCLNLLK